MGLLYHRSFSGSQSSFLFIFLNNQFPEGHGGCAWLVMRAAQIGVLAELGGGDFLLAV